MLRTAYPLLQDRVFEVLLAAMVTLMVATRVLAVPKAVPDTKGTHFLFTTPLCRPDSPASMYVVPQTTVWLNVTLTHPNHTVDRFMLPPSRALRSPLACLAVEWNTLSNGVFLLESSVEVMLYIEYADDCHYVYPTDTLATKFTTAHMLSHSFDVYFFVVIGKNTNLEITIPSGFSAVVEFNGTQYVKNDVLNVHMESGRHQSIAIKVSSDLSQITIRATLPVSVLIGAFSTDNNIGVIEPLSPSVIWGRRFIYLAHSWMSEYITLSITGKTGDADISIIHPGHSETVKLNDHMVLSMQVVATNFLAIEANSSILCMIVCGISDASNTSHLTLTSLTPLVLFHVSSSFVANDYDEVSANFLLTVHSFAHISLNKTSVSDPFHRPMVFFWKLFLSREIPLINSHAITTSDNNVVPFYGVVLCRNVTAAHAYSLGMRITHIYDACTRSESVHGGNGDGIDNDCDNRIDEEWLNGKDDDGDIEADEDVRYSGSRDADVALNNAWLYHLENKDVDLGISNSVLSVVISIVVALVSVGCFLGGMLLAERIRMAKESTHVTPITA